MGYALPNVIKIGLWDVGVCAIFMRLETIKHWLHSGQVAMVGCHKHRLKKKKKKKISFYCVLQWGICGYQVGILTGWQHSKNK
jgi:hypothetical protein